jgi:large subunit ribosomal protein L32
MAVSKQRKTKSRRNQRRMHIHLDKPTLVVCPHCKEKKLMHAVCKACGYYKNREIIDVLKEKKTPKEKETTEKKKPLNIESLSKK